jgi:hypothetical protein
MAQETFNTQFNFQGFNTLKKDLREATQLYQQMLQSGTATTQQMEQQARVVAGLKDRIDDANEATAALTGAGRIQAFGRAITAVSGGFTALQGVIALTGTESEDLQKTMVKLQAAMSITMGLAQLEDFSNAMKNAARATGLQTVAMRAYTFVTNGATVATRTLRAAMISLGAGAILVGLGLLVNKFMELAQASKDANKSLEDYQKNIEDAASKGSAFVSTLQSQINSNFEVIKKALKEGKESVTLLTTALGKDESGKTILKSTETNLKLSLSNIKVYYDSAKKVQVEYLKTVANIQKEALESSLIVKEGEQEKALEQMKASFKREEELRKTIVLSQGQRGTPFYQGLMEDLEKTQNLTANFTATYRKLSAEIALTQQQILGIDFTKRDFVESLDQQFKDIQEIVQETNTGIQKESKESFDKTIANYLEGRKEQLANEKDFNEKFIREVIATAKSEEEIQLEQFDNERKLREKTIQDEINTNKELVKLYSKRLQRNDITDQERAEILAKRKKLNEQIANLELQLNVERTASDSEYANLTKELADLRLKREQQLADDLIAEQKRIADEFKKSLDDQMSAIDQFYERKKRAAFTGLESQAEFDKKERDLEIEKLERQIKNLEFLGLSTEEQEFRLRVLRRESAEEEVRLRTEAANAVIAIGQASFQGLIDLDNIRLQNALNNDNISNAEKERLAKESFDRQKALYKAMAILDAAKAVTSIYAEYPKFDGGIMMFLALGLAAVQLGVAMAKINEAQYVSPVSAGAGGAVNLSSKFAMGGMLIGPSHSQGGIKTSMGELEGGEFVVNRIASQAFLPILEQINSVGQSNSERMMMPSAPQPIIKTYVVATDMDSALEKKRKIEKLARL